MNKECIYIEPSIIRYESNSPIENITHRDLDAFNVFSNQMLEVIDIIDLLKYKVVISAKIMEEIVKANPTIPFNISNILDIRIKSTAKVLHDKITRFISKNFEIIATDSFCNLNSDFIEVIGTTQDYFLDFLELILTGCENLGQVSSDKVLKDINSVNFRECTYEIYCDKYCSKEFKKRVDCLSVYDLKEENKIIIADLELLESITDYNPQILASSNDHHSVFGRKIERFDDIPEPEKGLFTSLNKIADIKEVIFREFIGTTNEGEGKLYGFFDLDCDDIEYARIKGSLSLKRRGPKPQGCEVELYIKRIPFEKLRECMHVKNVKVIDVEFLKEYIKMVKEDI